MDTDMCKTTVDLSLSDNSNEAPEAHGDRNAVLPKKRNIDNPEDDLSPSQLSRAVVSDVERSASLSSACGGDAPLSSSPPVTPPSPALPPCPGCGRTCDVRKVTKHGPNTGRDFFVCPLLGEKQCKGWVGWASNSDTSLAKSSKVGMSFSEIRQREREEASACAATAKGRNEGELASGSFVRFSKKSRSGFSEFENGRRTDVFSASAARAIAKAKRSAETDVATAAAVDRGRMGQKKSAANAKAHGKGNGKHSVQNKGAPSQPSSAPAKSLSVTEMREARLRALSGT